MNARRDLAAVGLLCAIVIRSMLIRADAKI
jgi:hypothetical protein